MTAMTKKLPILHFFSVVLAFGLLAGCETTGVAPQNNSKQAVPAVPAAVPGVSTLAGSGEKGAADGIGATAQFHFPNSITIDAAGNLYVVDTHNNSIRKVTPTGMVSTLAGSGEKGYADGVGRAAQFYFPQNITIDAVGNLYVTDGLGNNRIRKITLAGVVSTVAGSGEQGDADGVGQAAQFNAPSGITIDAAGNLYVADFYNNLIRKITPAREVTTLAGSGIRGDTADGIGRDAAFKGPNGITIDAAGNLYVVESQGDRVRKITPAGVVSTVAGSGARGYADGVGRAAQFSAPSGITMDSAGNLYVTDGQNNRIRKITPNGEVSTLAGGEQGYADGVRSAAKFYWPQGIAIDAAGHLYVADTFNHRIRKIVIE
ncbi:MAG: hypothetical protein LBE62_13540 [Azonexus sp.]|jgi:sugar lactone lactonase YvrE|nr:hypothetical protein [Azonexus sp.]